MSTTLLLHASLTSSQSPGHRELARADSRAPLALASGACPWSASVCRPCLCSSKLFPTGPTACQKSDVARIGAGPTTTRPRRRPTRPATTRLTTCRRPPVGCRNTDMVTCTCGNMITRGADRQLLLDRPEMAMMLSESTVWSHWRRAASTTLCHVPLL